MPEFRRGKSGNPAGRPPGRPDKRVALRKLLEPHAPALVAKVAELALQGDTAALRLCDAPRRRYDTEPVHWPRPSAVRLRRAPGGRLLARAGRECPDGVREATFAVSACVDGLCATGAGAELVEISRPLDTDAAWQIGGLNRLIGRYLSAPEDWLQSEL